MVVPAMARFAACNSVERADPGLEMACNNLD
jgi:hypothetical protein